MMVLLMSRMTFPLSSTVMTEKWDLFHSISKLGEVLTWILFEDLFSLEFVFIFDLLLYGHLGIPVMVQCFLPPAVELLEKGCGEFYSLLENLTEEL